MKEIRDIIRRYELADPEMECALATVVQVEGSSYRRIGARMLVFQDGTWVGGISGGCLEGDALRKSKLAMLQKKAKLIRYDTREDSSDSIGIGLGCNGLIDVLLQPIDRNDSSIENPILLLKKCSETRKAQILLSIISFPEDPSFEGQLFEEDHFFEQGLLDSSDSDDLNEAIHNSWSNKKSKIWSSKNIRILIEFIPPSIQLFIFGGQYDVYSLLQISNILAWKSNLIANLSKVAQTTQELATHCWDKNEIKENHKKLFNLIDKYSVAILMAHDYETDKEHLAHLLKCKSLSYIGLLGPKKRTDKILKTLGINEASNLERIFSPVGLDTGATSPEEIAISIVAEIRAHFSQRKGQMLRDRKGPINDRL